MCLTYSFGVLRLSQPCRFGQYLFGEGGNVEDEARLPELGRCRWQSALISLVLSCVESKTTASPKRSSGQLVMAKSAVR